MNNLIRKIQDEVVLCDKRVTGKEAIKGYPKAFLIKLDLQTLKKSPHGQSLKFQQKKHPNFLGIYIHNFYKNIKLKRKREFKEKK